MPITIQWDNTNQSVLLIAVSGLWSLEERNQTVEKAFAMIRSVDHPVHVMLDVSRNRFTPSNFLPLMYQAANERPASMSSVVIVTNRTLVRIVVNTFLKLYPSVTLNIHFVASILEARQYIVMLQRDHILQP